MKNGEIGQEKSMVRIKMLQFGNKWRETIMSLPRMNLKLGKRLKE
jgi:hypothetical protein